MHVWIVTHPSARRASVAGWLPNLAVHVDEERYERENKKHVDQNARNVIHHVASHPREKQQKR